MVPAQARASDRPPRVASVIETSVVFPSYRRPGDLERAIASVLAQEGVATSYEILVVDNDPAGSAEPVATVMAARSQVPIRYVREPRPGISHARNAGVGHAAGRYLAFLDDDEEADPHWLAQFTTALERFGADAVVGPVYPLFPASSREIDAYRQRV